MDLSKEPFLVILMVPLNCHSKKEKEVPMSKQVISVKKPEITLDQNSSVPLYRQIYERLRSHILTGQLETGARLPSTRTLAAALGVSRNTTALAYEHLLLEGYIESRVGDGTKVADLQSEHLFLTRKNVETLDQANNVEQLPARISQRNQLFINESSIKEEDTNQASATSNLFRAGLPDITFFPYENWTRLLAKHARQSLQALSLYQHPQGYTPLREAIAAHIGITRGVHCSPEQIILTSGAQGAFDLIARVLLDPGDASWVEDPGYPDARGALLASGAKLVPVPVDQEGINVEIGRELCHDARMALVTPSHQFPTGVTMSLSRRLALLEWAKEAQAWIVEDDYDSEYRFSGRPLEALHSLDNAGRVLYIGTFSKVLFPSLRLGYLVVPPILLKNFLVARHFIDIHLPLLEQIALTEFMTEGYFIQHLKKMRLLYMERRNTLIEELNQNVGAMLEVTIPQAGMHLVAWLAQELNAQTLFRKIEKSGLRISPVSRFSLQTRQRDGLLFGFACSSSEEIRAGVHRLALALRS